MRRLGPLLLVLLVALTGTSLGHARGQVLAGGTVVLCSGAVMSAPVEKGGAPLICPDMALSLMTATAVPPPVVAVERVAVAFDLLPPVATAVPAGPLREPQARGPPSLV